MRVEIEQAWDMLATDIYGLSEIIGPGVSQECTYKDGLHVFSDVFYPEIIDPETGKPVEEGQDGELVITTLTKQAMPLLRYRTGDLTVKRDTDPVCGRRVNLPRVVFGRTDDMVKVKGVKVYPSEVRAVLLGLDGLTGKYRVTVSAKPGGGDRLALALEGTADDAVAEEVARRFKSQTLISADEIATVAELDDGPALVDARGGTA